MSSQPELHFGRFRLLPARRLLMADEQPVKLGSRAFDLLCALVQQRDRVLTKQQLLDAVWPNQVVEEANLAVQVLALRKILGPGAIATQAGRGYRFAWPATERLEADLDRVQPRRPPTNLPGRVETLLGRASEHTALQAMLVTGAHVTLVGSGGVGKTHLAQHVAHSLLNRFAEGVWWLELAPLSDPALVASAVARVLHTSATAERTAEAAVAARLGSGPTLLVLDNAEHVLDGVAPLVTLLRQQAPQATLLVTSQEPLRTRGEKVMRLSPLSLPVDDSLQSAELSGAVALFTARAQAVQAVFRLDQDTRAAVVDICRKLDGIALALEMAAARLPLLGLDGVRQRLDERFQVLTQHDRASLPRHRTLRAALEWSHGLLVPVEQVLLRHMAVFGGGFTLDAAQWVAKDVQTDSSSVIHLLGGLVDKSLVVRDDAPFPRYRLLETTRLYGLEQLSAAGELALALERHARAMDNLLKVPRPDARRWRTPPAPQAVLGAEVDNARAALGWAIGCNDEGLVISLAAGCSHVFLSAGLNAEYLARVLPLRARLTPTHEPAAAGLFWARIALACSRNAHPAGLEAALNAASIYRALGDAERLYDALTWAIAIGARQSPEQPLQALVDEALALEQADWPPAARSSLQWAIHRWLQLQGLPQQALRCAEAQAELLAQEGSWITHVAWGANVADCELALGNTQRAERLARAALDALEEQGIDENIVGHVMDVLMISLTLQGRQQEAVAVGRRARRLLDREGDDLRLLDTLAMNATTGARWLAAAQVAGHADACVVQRGESRWPAGQARRAQLQAKLLAELSSAELQVHLKRGADISRDQAFALAFGDKEPG
jgi:predicted ATPase/DNA-binding winged helix-turn-helix (wHTH) protein